MKRRILILDPQHERWRLETLQVESLPHAPREDYFTLSGEALCQYLLRRRPEALTIARGPMPFLSGNKATVGYISPLTGLPHYSIVGGRSAAELTSLGLDAICFMPDGDPEAVQVGERPYVTVSGYAPDLRVNFHSADLLPRGQRSAYYWLAEHELGSRAHQGSIFTIGQGARHGYRTANLAVDVIYHAGRGGAGQVFARYASALVLQGQIMDPGQYWRREVSSGTEANPGRSAFIRNPNASIASLVETHCARLSAKTGGTIAKLYATGAQRKGGNTLPSHNARRLGYPLADLGSPRILQRTRQGQTGCQWCQVDCRHWHTVPADYAPDGRDMLLDDFEPAFAIYAMLGLQSQEDSLESRLELLQEVERQVMLPVEEMGCDLIDVGLGLAALFEGIESGLLPLDHVPPSLSSQSDSGNLDALAQAVTLLQSGEAANYPALRAAADGPQALAERYPALQDSVFSSGKGTLGNAGHSNALWTFLMPFSRYFGHYVGQLYKIEADLPPQGAAEEDYRSCFRDVVHEALEREFFWLLGNVLSQCAFTFVIFSQDGLGKRLSDDGLLIRLLQHYGIHTTPSELRWFSQAFWAQSVALKGEYGWRPPSARDLPFRVYESLALALDRPALELQQLMDWLIDEWRCEARGVLERFGYEVTW